MFEYETFFKIFFGVLFVVSFLKLPPTASIDATQLVLIHANVCQ